MTSPELIIEQLPAVATDVVGPVRAQVGSSCPASS
jgi:hypothetical protein